SVCSTSSIHTESEPLSLHDALPIYEDVFPNDVGRSGPEPLEIWERRIALGQVAGEGDVIDQRIEPDKRHKGRVEGEGDAPREPGDRKSTRLNSSHQIISYAVFCLKT